MTRRDGLQERNGVRLGQRVRDLDGRTLGRVTALYESAFAVSKGWLLFRREVVAGYGEIREARGGELVLARSARDLHELARGGMPPAWRVLTQGPLPSYATPSEARLLPGGPRADGSLPPPSEPARPPRQAWTAQPSPSRSS